MAKNLNTDRFNNGNLILHAKSPSEWDNANSNMRPAWCYVNYDQTNGLKFGKLYNWYAVNDPRGLAPKGWRIPNEEDWSDLIASLELENQVNLLLCNKINSQKCWSAMLGGYRTKGGNFYRFGSDGFWWSSNEYDKENAFYFRVNSDCTYRSFEDKSKGYSVRCIKNKF